MNRQERRRMGIKKKDPMISIKKSDIDAMKEEATEKGCKMAFNLMLAVPAMVIHDKFGSLMKKGRTRRKVRGPLHRTVQVLRGGVRHDRGFKKNFEG